MMSITNLHFVCAKNAALLAHNVTDTGTCHLAGINGPIIRLPSRPSFKTRASIHLIMNNMINCFKFHICFTYSLHFFIDKVFHIDKV